MPLPSVLMGDDHPLILEGLRRLLEGRFNLIGAERDGRALVASAERLKPDVVLLDIAMPLLNGVEAARQIRAALPHTKLVVITQHTDRHYLEAAFGAGVSAYVVKQSASADLLDAIDAALHGRIYVSEQLRRTLPAPLSMHAAADMFGGTLTPRQREVLQLVAEGKAIKEIADVLKISPKTVEFHKASIMNELGLRTTAELTRYAIANGIVPH